MSSCFVLNGATGDEGLGDGLAGILSTSSLALDTLFQPGVFTLEQGSVCLLAASVLDALPRERLTQLASATLARGVHVIILPPFGSSTIPSMIPGIAPGCLSNAGDLGPVSVADGGLAQACGVRELRLLYTQVIEFAPARQLVVAADGRPVAVRYRHSSNWGELVVSTLLLASASVRSSRAHRVALAHGLVTWLTEQQPLRPDSFDTATQAPSERELNIALLALARQPAPTGPSGLTAEVSAIRSRLGDPEATVAIERIAEWLAAAAVVIPTGPDSWLVDAGRLASELASRSLGAYLRRLA